MSDSSGIFGRRPDGYTYYRKLFVIKNFLRGTLAQVNVGKRDMKYSNIE